MVDLKVPLFPIVRRRPVDRTVIERRVEMCQVQRNSGEKEEMLYTVALVEGAEVLKLAGCQFRYRRCVIRPRGQWWDRRGEWWCICVWSKEGVDAQVICADPEESKGGRAIDIKGGGKIRDDVVFVEPVELTS